MPITFSGYTRSEPLTNFPALVTFTNFTGFLSSSGHDLRFWTNSFARGTPLNYEISGWSNNGISYVWVQVPELTSATTIYATWGNPTYNFQDAYTTNGAVWTNMYAAVWHMNQATNPVDSCRFPNDHSVAGGQFGDLTNTFLGYGLNYTNFGLAPIQNYSDVSNTFTLSFWYYPRSNGGNIGGGTGFGALFGDDALGNSYPGITRHSGNGTPLGFRNNYTYRVFSPITEFNAWHYFSWRGAYPSINPSVITDGSAIASGSPLDFGIAPLFLIGTGSSIYRCIDGIATEMRMSTKIMTTNWVWAEYQNMASNAVFQSYGPLTIQDLVGTKFFFR